MSFDWLVVRPVGLVGPVGWSVGWPLHMSRTVVAVAEKYSERYGQRVKWGNPANPGFKGRGE